MAKINLPELIASNEDDLLREWLRLQTEVLASRRDRVSDTQLRASSQEFIKLFSASLSQYSGSDIAGAAYSRMRNFLSELSHQRATQGFSPSETAILVFSFKQPLFKLIEAEKAGDAQTEIWFVTEILDKLGLYTIETFQRTREEVILRQQQEMLELSTPVVELWSGILALPLIGTLDSARTQIVMQNLLEAIVNKGADLAIIDITGVPTVDTLVAQHLLKTVAAARLMGADCIISGIRPQIAQTIIHLGVDLSGVMTKATLADAIQLALKKKNLTISRN